MPLFKIETSIPFKLQEKKEIVQDIHHAIISTMVGVKIQDIKIFWHQTNIDSNLEIFNGNNEELVFYAKLELLNTPQRTKTIRANCGKACLDVIINRTKNYKCTPVIQVVPLEIYIKGDHIYYPNPPIHDE